MNELLDYAAVRDSLIARLVPVGTESVSLPACAGRVLAEDLIALEDIPPFDRSPYDGYAFRAADTVNASPDSPVTLRVLETVPAGSTPTRTISAGTAVRLMTGAPIPDGADAVCMFEKTAFTEDSVMLFTPLHAGENIIFAGEDVAKGAVLAHRGDRIDAGIAGTLAAQGQARPLVYRRVRVGLISTGNEVVEADARPLAGQIRNSNRSMLEAALLREGMEAVYLGLAGDDTSCIARLITEGVERCDAVILTGGVSVGDYDLTPAAMDAAGCDTICRGVALKPGMACAYDMLRGKPICGLSGNPASSLTNFCLIALPALRRMAGWNRPVPQEIKLTLRTPFRKKSPFTRVLRGRLDLADGTVGLVLPGDQGNVVLSSTIGCNAMAIVPAGSGPLAEGAVLKGFLL